MTDWNTERPSDLLGSSDQAAVGVLPAERPSPLSRPAATLTTYTCARLGLLAPPTPRETPRAPAAPEVLALPTPTPAPPLLTFRKATFKLPQTLADWLRAYAANHHQFQYHVVTEAIRHHLRDASCNASPVEHAPAPLPDVPTVVDDPPEWPSRRDPQPHGLLEDLLGPR